MKILILGDLIVDNYKFCKATRLCPEAPAPVLEVVSERSVEGGAGLVAANIKALLDGQEPDAAYGSLSYKTRIFADRTLICRLDHDSLTVSKRDSLCKVIEERAKLADAIVVSDYGKGAMDESTAATVIMSGKPAFVDAKHDKGWYEGAFCMFPNEHETLVSTAAHIIRKLGARGCKVDEYEIPTTRRRVYDVTGAGDVFLAAFVVSFMRSNNEHGYARLEAAAKAANKAAGLSVEHLGTHIVTPAELHAEPDADLTSKEVVLQ